MECVYFVIFFVVIGWIISLFQNRGNKEVRELRRALSKGFTVENKRGAITLDSGDAIDVYTVSISGTVAVPAPKTECDLIVEIADITHDTDDKDELRLFPSISNASSCHDWPVLCLIPDLANSAGFFESHEELTIPYEISTLKKIPILSVPVSALVFPKKGRRQARISVSLTSKDGLAHVYCLGRTVILHEQDFYGYTETEKRDIEADKAIVALALCLCAADGQITQTEAAVIRGYCTDALMNLDRDEAAKRKEAANKTMRVFLRNYKSGGQIKAFWNQACDRIMERHGAQVAQAAYELCLRTVAADGNADDRELSMLTATARRLEIPDDLDREFRHRHLPLGIFRGQTKDAFIGMPDGLSREEKIEFVNREYQKWLRLATHPDSEIATEANLRVKRLAEVRRRLEDE